MARAGMTGWRGRHAPVSEGGDDVQKSLELLDQVLSEFDDLENGNVGGSGGPGPTPGVTVADADSPSLGHQSEDDGYMSMNGRRTKFLLDLPPAPEPPSDPLPPEMADFPPPPEEAQRLIANLLPRVSSPAVMASPGHPRTRGKPIMSAASLEPFQNGVAITAATQTTLPKTRHQRPYGWRDNQPQIPPCHLQGHKFGSLPYESMLHNARYPPPWMQRPGPLPPRTLAGAVDRHREVRRQRSANDICATPPPPPEDDATFSDDSLEGCEQSQVVDEAQRAQVVEVAAPQDDVAFSPGHRGSIAWEVPLDDSLMAPGSTKVLGRRRKSSNDRSSNGSLNRSKDADEWPEPPGSVGDDSASGYSEQDAVANALALDLTFNGTYVIRKGRKRERTPVQRTSKPPPTRQCSLDSRKEHRTSATFDNIKQLLIEGRIEGLNDPPPDFPPPTPPTLVRVLSLPTLPSEEVEYREIEEPVRRCDRNSKSGDRYSNELATTVEEAEDELSSLDNPSLNYVNLMPLCYDDKPLPEPPEDEDDVELRVESEAIHLSQGPILKAVEVETQTDLSDLETQTELEIVGKQIREISKTKSELEEVEKKIQEIVKIKTTLEREREKERDLAGDPWVRASDLPPAAHFPVQVEVHEFGPLPPSPVDEFDAYSELFHPASQPMRRKADTLPEPFYRCDLGSDPGGLLLHRPPELPPHRQDPVSSSLKSRSSDHGHVSNSLKTRSMDAGFARGPKVYCNGSRREAGSERRTLPCELPGPASRRRTLQKRPSTSPQDNGQTSCSLPETPIFARGCDIPRTPARGSTGTSTGSYRPAGVPIAGAELLRLTGGPARGWYPRQRHPRPASSEHLDRLPMPPAWDTARKPMTLPPNITPKFFHRSPRDALRRVTSLLIRGKGSGSKDPKKEMMAAMPVAEHTDTVRQKRGFFRSLWKRSRHYSLDQQ